MIPARLRTAVQNRLPVTMRRAREFERCHGFRPSLRDPRTFSEKLNHRVLRDRRPVLAPLGDKLAMKDVARRSGAAVRVPETWWAGTDLHELAALEVVGPWVLKPNHRTNGEVVFGSGPILGPDDLDDLAVRTRGWLGPNRHSRGLGEWAYTRARPLLVLEEHVGRGGEVPDDYKVYVFGGVPALVQVHEDRFGRHTKRLYRPDWTPLPDQPGYPPSEPSPPPVDLPALLTAASVLARGLDFLRVDLYVAQGQVWFGELTPYPSSGLRRLAPASLDAELGALWTLPVRARGRRPYDR